MADRALFEKLCLEGFQAGLSWLTILRKRANFRTAFRSFTIEKVALFDDRDRARLLRNKGIIRHGGKINATINNAQRALELQQEFGSLAAYFWRFAPASESRPCRITRAFLANNARTPESTALSRDLKKRGWAFVGPTTVYAFMQAMGLVNDHVDGCYIGMEVERERLQLAR